MSKKRVEEILIETEVLLNGHFLLASGRHSNQYMQCAKICQYPARLRELTEIVGKQFIDDKIDVVVAPAVGAIIFGYEMASFLGVKNMFTEKEDGEMVFRRAFELEKGARVLVVEDVITTGGSVVKVMDAVKENGGEVVGVALLVDRSGGKIDFGVKTVASYTADVISFDKDDCPLCKDGKSDAYKPGSK